jgi:hypothetical protein
LQKAGIAEISLRNLAADVVVEQSAGVKNIISTIGKLDSKTISPKTG